ncbi:MAG: leucine-rich repeat domain-containing protein [Lachnospiraceae bacterium]|nr:leucine-rich repeat domain-containing protein [Lachnospiraceae bacterium]
MKRKNAAALLLTLGLAVSGNGTVAFAAEPIGETPMAETPQETEAADKNGMAPESASVENGKTEETGGAATPAKTGEMVTAGGETEADVSRIVSFTDYTGMRVTYDAHISQQYVYEVEKGILKGVKMKTADADEGKTPTAAVFEGNVELKQPEEGEKYTSVASDVFGGNQNITYVKLPAGVTVIAEGCFKGCTGLKSVHLPSTVTLIGDGAFEGCTAMTQISIPKSVTAIGDHAFQGDVKLQTVQIREAAESELTSVGAHAFEGCRSLQQMTLPQMEVTVGEGAFEDGMKLTIEGKETQ